MKIQTKEQLITMLDEMNKSINEVNTFYDKHPELKGSRIRNIEINAIKEGMILRLIGHGVSKNMAEKIIYSGCKYRVNRDFLPKLYELGFKQLPFVEMPYISEVASIDHEGIICWMKSFKDLSKIIPLDQIIVMVG